MTPEIVAAYIGIGLTIIGGIYAIVNNKIKSETQFALMKQSIDNIEKEAAALKEHNTKQHEELYSSRNDMREVLAELSGLFKSVKEKTDSMDVKIDRLLERRATER